jgi:hypothetical protein
VRDGLRDDLVLAEHETPVLRQNRCGAHAASPVIARFLPPDRGALFPALAAAATALRRSLSTASHRSMISGSLSLSAFARNCLISAVVESAAILSRVQLTDLLGIFAIMIDSVG